MDSIRACRRVNRIGLCAIPGVRVGHSHRVGDGWLTGVTVVLTPSGSTGVVEPRGGAVASFDTTALAVGAVAGRVDAIVLTGGSAFGLRAVSGVQDWCFEHGIGLPASANPEVIVPIVSGAAIFDLGRGGAHNPPNAEMGYMAAASAVNDAQVRGSVGAGVGAAIDQGRHRGGLGLSAMTIPLSGGNGIVAAMSVVNAYGTERSHADNFVHEPTAGTAMNTTLNVVGTNVVLSQVELSRLAVSAHDGIARSLEPAHTDADGDIVFAFSTNNRELDQSQSRLDELLRLQIATPRVVEGSIIDALESASPLTSPYLSLPVLPASGALQ